MNPEIRQLHVQRWSIRSGKPFDQIAAALQAAIGHPDMSAFSRTVSAAQTFADLEEVIRKMLGPSDFMEFARFDLGAILKKESGQGPNIHRYVIGNPLIMKEMVKHVRDAGSYAPVTVLIDERADGIHLSYDRMASFIEPYGSTAALAVARDLDAKVERLLAEVARDGG